jgi:hypothetical protein
MHEQRSRSATEERTNAVVSRVRTSKSVGGASGRVSYTHRWVRVHSLWGTPKPLAAQTSHVVAAAEPSHTAAYGGDSVYARAPSIAAPHLDEQEPWCM